MKRSVRRLARILLQNLIVSLSQFLHTPSWKWPFRARKFYIVESNLFALWIRLLNPNSHLGQLSSCWNSGLQKSINSTTKGFHKVSDSLFEPHQTFKTNLIEIGIHIQSLQSQSFGRCATEELKIAANFNLYQPIMKILKQDTQNW
jgi:hypothetical protein